MDEYERFLNSDSSKYLKYFLYTSSADVSDDFYDATSHYSEFQFESGKSFANVFYPEKEDIVKRINFFTNNKAWYKKQGIPYTMGFMFYGTQTVGRHPPSKQLQTTLSDTLSLSP